MNSHHSDIQFSVIIPLYNKGPHIHRSVQSVLNQTYTKFELLIVDDGSTDNSLDVVSNFKDDRIHVLKRNKPGPGGYAARNHGARHAKNDWLAYLDADDEWMPDHLEKMLNLMEKNKDLKVFGAGWKIQDPDQGNSLSNDSFYDTFHNESGKVLRFEDYLQAEIKGLRPICSSVAVIHKDTFSQSGGFPEGKVRRGGDVDTWLRCIEIAQGIAWSSHIGAVYYRDSINMVTRSENLLATAERETVARLVKKYHGHTQTLLKQFANKRTISAWKQSLTIPDSKLLLHNKLYLSGSLRIFLFILASFLPKKFVLTLKNLSTNPKYKKFIISAKRIQKLRFLDSVAHKKNISILSNNNYPTFFGYHDKTPFNSKNEFVLAMSTVNSDTKAEIEGTPIKVGYFKRKSSGKFENKFIPVAETNTWCWQQGSMLQWHPLNPESHIIFNKLVNGKYGCAVLDLNGFLVREYSTPIYSISPTGKNAASLNFSRLGRLRPGYGYNNIPDHTRGILAPKDDGLFLLNLETDEKKLLISLSSLADFFQTMDSENYINHATFSPNGRTIAFFHIYVRNGKRSINFCIIDSETGVFKLIENSRTISHYCWKSENEILATSRSKDKRWNYSIYDILKDSFLDLPVTKEDGHPMFHPQNSDVFVTDTYPDQCRDQLLKVAYINKKRETLIGRFYSPFSYDGQVRCDLHPRWDRTGSSIAIDSAFQGKRKLVIVDLV